jgi:hypothetical protein
VDSANSCACSGYDCNPNSDNSFFNIVQPTNGAPARVRVTMVLKSTGSPSHIEYIGNQTLIEEVTQRTYAR